MSTFPGGRGTRRATAGMWSGARARARAAAALLAAVAALAPIGCTRSAADEAPRTPEETVAYAQELVATNRAEELPRLIYAEDERMRSLINQSGRVLGALQDLGAAVQERFPTELAELREQAARAAEEGRASSLLTQLVSGESAARGSATFGARRTRTEGLRLDTGTTERASPSAMNVFGSGEQAESRRQVFNSLAKQLLSDPYGWLEGQRSRLGTQYIADDRAALTWDGRTILPPLGLMLQETEFGWQLVLPTSYPFVRQIMPRTEQEFLVWGSILKTVENVVVDLTADVRSGRVVDLTDLADTAVEKIAVPAVLIWLAYSELVEDRQAKARAAREAKAAAASTPNSPSTPATEPASPPAPVP